MRKRLRDLSWRAVNKKKARCFYLDCIWSLLREREREQSMEIMGDNSPSHPSVLPQISAGDQALDAEHSQAERVAGRCWR